MWERLNNFFKEITFFLSSGISHRYLKSYEIFIENLFIQYVNLFAIKIKV